MDPAAHPTAKSLRPRPQPAPPPARETSRHDRRRYRTHPPRLPVDRRLSLSVVSGLERQPRASCRSRTLARLAAALGRPPADLTAPGVRLAAP